MYHNKFLLYNPGLEIAASHSQLVNTMKWKNIETGKVIEISRRAHLLEKVLLELSKEPSLTTPELNGKLASKGCFSTCKSLQELGLVESSLDKKYTLWDPVTKQVITKENYDAIMMQNQEARERLTKQMKAEGLTDEEIAKKLADLIDPRSLEVSYRTWWLSKKWKPLQ